MTEPCIAQNAYNYPLLIKQILTTGVAASTDTEIVSGTLLRYRYRTLDLRIRRLARALSLLGVGQGQTVAVMDWDTHRYFECFFAVPMMGAILHTINIRLAPEQILYTINHADDDVILVHHEFLPILEQIADRIERPVKLVLLRDEKGAITLPEGFVAEYETMIEQAEADYTFEDFDENTTATTFYTTGTTGDPKGVFYSHRQIVLHTLGVLGTLGTIDHHLRFHRKDVYLPMTPLFHVHGWGFPYAATMLGIKQVYAGRYEPARLLELIAREGATFSHCVPTILQMLLTHSQAADTDLSALKVIIGGSALPLGLLQQAQQHRMQLYSAYGMSETCPLLTYADLSAHAPDDTSEPANLARLKTGKAALLVDLKVVDNAMNEVPADGQSTGEVVVRAPWLTRGYCKNQQGSDALWQDGYLHTGDVGNLDQDRSLQITDRTKDVIKSGGEWISSIELENIASGCDLVAEVAAIGINDSRWGERPLLLVVPAGEYDSTQCVNQVRQVIEQHIDAGKLSKWAMPERIELVDQIEKTSVGKLDKKLLRARYNEV